MASLTPATNVIVIILTQNKTELKTKSPTVIPFMQFLNGFRNFYHNSLIIKLWLKYNLKIILYNQRQNTNMIGFPSVYPRHHRASSCIKFVAFRLEHHRKSISWAGVFDLNRKSTQKKKLASIVLFLLKGLVFLTFLFFCSFFLLLRKLRVFFMKHFFCCCKSCAMMPSGGSQVDIADICRSGGLIQLLQAFPAGASLCLLLLL